MKKKPILNAYETKLFNDWIEDGNAFKNDKGVWLEQTTQYNKNFTYDELQNFFKREYLAEGYNGGGRVKTKEYFQIYKLEDLRRKTELLLTDVELSKFLDTWNFDYKTDYADWIEFNEYEDSVKITPVFSKNEYGGNVNNSFVESEINSVSTWENEEIATYLEVPVNEVAKHRDYYVEETQNAMLVNQVDGDYAGGGEVTYMQYNGVEIMYEPHFREYYVNDEIFTSLEDAIKYIDNPLSSGKKEARKKLKENIIKALFIDKKSIVTEVTFTYQGEYSVGYINKQDIRNMVFEINQSKKYNPINIFTNSYGVLTLQLDKTYADGGDVPHADKMFQLPLEMVIYVPSTQDVDKVISVDKMDKRVDEVKIYLANKFGGYTSADKLGGFVDSTGNLVNEDVVQVTSFSTKEAYAENKEELINQLAKWGEEWGQESIGFEFEGDLMYVPQKFKKGGESKKIGFKGLANKVANRYEGKKVAPKFQSEYGKTYSKEEAQEVGNKVAGKVYREQQSNKLANGGKLKEYNHLKEYYEKYVNGGFVGGDIIKFKYDGKEFTRKVESVDDMGNALVNLMKTQKATINPADIFDIKKDFSEKDVIIKKIGLNENLAEYLVSVSPTFAVWFADAIVENEIEERQESKEVVLKAINEKSFSKNTNYFNNNFGGSIREILDWLQHPSTPKQNLRDLSFNEALEKSRQWHQELTTSGGDLNFVEPDENTILITYPPNEFGKTYYWVFIPKNYCDIESSRMGHCGRTGAGSLISLRSFFTNINNESVTDSHVTIAYNKDDGLFYQAKGKQNRKPVEKYFPYIFNLIKLMASGKLEEEYKLKLEDKLNDLRSQEKKAQAGLQKIAKYFESKEARTENAESIVEKANKLVSIREKLNEIGENIKILDSESRFDFNGFDSEYQSSNDYGYEDFTTEQIKELYQLKPEMFKDFAGQYMLFQAGVVSEKPNTIFTLEKPVEYVSDLLRLNRDFSDDYVRQVLTGDTDDLFSGGDYSYYYTNAGDYVDDLNKEDYDKVLNEIVEITQLDKEIIKENGAKYYLDGDDEEFSADNFGDIKIAIANSLEVAERSSYENYYYNQIKDALQELGTVKELTDEGVILEIDLANLISIGEISSYMKDLDSDNLEDVFVEAESNSGIELPSLNIDERYGGRTDGWQEYFDINNYAEGGAVYPDLSMQKAQVVNDSIRIPEFELKQAKEVVVIEGVTNKKILNSDDAIEIFRNIWGKDTINAYEQCYVLYLNKGMKPIGYYHHSSGGINGTVMDIQMISGMAIKSLAKGVMIAHNHPSGNTQPSDADKRITEQMKKALKLFNIELLDSIILTDNSDLSFADEGLL
jgi:DNA repair protein RadC